MDKPNITYKGRDHYLAKPGDIEYFTHKQSSHENTNEKRSTRGSNCCYGSKTNYGTSKKSQKNDHNMEDILTGVI